MVYILIDYSLTRSRRKTAAIYVRKGRVEVRAPLNMPKRDIDRFVFSKEDWIRKTLASQAALAASRDSFKLDYGSKITFRGKLYPIAPRNGSRAGFDGEVFYMPPGLTGQQIKSLCVQIYRRLALTYFTARTAYFAEKMGVAPAAIKVTNAKTRWGSCSSKKSINFSWRLALADDDVIDYVIVHELAHLKEMNHSPRFWAIVEKVMPDYAYRKLKLKSLQQRLTHEGWE